MNKYYFYTLHEERISGSLKDTYDNLRKEEGAHLKNNDIMLYALCSQQRASLGRHSEQYELQNGIDVRYLVKYGLKEIDEESFIRIKEDDKRIVSKFNDKTKKLLLDYGHSVDGWHFPFMMEAKDKSHLKWVLKNKFPEYEIELKEDMYERV